MLPFCEDVAAAKNVNVMTAKEDVVAAKLVVSADLYKCIFNDNVFSKSTIAVSSIVAKM